MEPDHFDQSLRDIAASGDVPYQPALWEDLARRLDAHEKTAVVAAPRLPQRRIRLALPAAAAAACIAVALGTWLAIRPEEKDTKRSNPADRAVIASAPAATHPPVRVPASPVPEQRPEAGAPSRVRHLAAPGRRLALRSTGTQVAATSLSVAATLAADTTPPVRSAATATATASGPSAPPSGGSLAGNSAAASAPDPYRALALDLTGGYNVGSGRNAFTVGVSVKRSLGRRLRIEAGLAVVSGSYSRQQKGFLQAGGGGAYSPSMTSGVPSNSTPTSNSTTPVQQQEAETTEPLIYLQAAPSLNYQVTNRLSAGAGVDVQRLLTNTPASLNLSTDGALQPRWDFGLTGRVDFQVLPRLKTGLLYRAGLGGIAEGQGPVERRNYLLLQLGYTVF